MHPYALSHAIAGCAVTQQARCRTTAFAVPAVMVESGRHAAFRSPCPQGPGGSSPSNRTGRRTACKCARLAELADAAGSNPAPRNRVGVRVPQRALTRGI
jgi:hypothetical protein